MTEDAMVSMVRSRLKNHEDGFIERKPPGVSSEDICKTLVAFANSLDEGQQAILFIGVADKGALIGVENTDKMQKTVRTLAMERCYPSIFCTCVVFQESGKSIVAVIVNPSSNRPHFAGPAYMRRGSRSEKASAELFDELIASRNTKAGAILRSKGKLVTVIEYSPVYKRVPKIRHADAGNRIETIEYEARIIECDAHTVRLDRLGTHIAEPLDKISISRDEREWRLKLIIDNR